MIIKSELDYLYMKNLENCEYLSFFECINRGKNKLSNILILYGKQHLEKQVKKNNLNKDVSLAVSDKSYSNDEISFEWLKYFD